MEERVTYMYVDIMHGGYIVCLKAYTKYLREEYKINVTFDTVDQANDLIKDLQPFKGMYISKWRVNEKIKHIIKKHSDKLETSKLNLS